MKVLDSITNWFADHQAVLGWLTLASIVTFFASLILVPVVIARIPADYFLDRDRALASDKTPHPAVLIPLLILKNLLGLVLIVGGIAMLVLPGQGLLTIAIGASLLNFPGKRKIELWLIRRPAIHRAINWLRKRSGKCPLLLPPDDDDDSAAVVPADSPTATGDVSSSGKS